MALGVSLYRLFLFFVYAFSLPHGIAQGVALVLDLWLDQRLGPALSVAAPISFTNKHLISLVYAGTSKGIL